MADADPHTMRTLSAEEEKRGDKIATYLRSKWHDGACPYCHAVDWLVDPTPPPGFTRIYAVVCQNCGVVTFVHADYVGVEPS